VSTDIDICKFEGSHDLVGECQPAGYDDWTNNQQVLYWGNLQESIHSIDTYRYFELIAFYSQLLSIVIYIVYCKFFIKAKKYFESFDRYDPF
jgi:hypothetical protein